MKKNLNTPSDQVNVRPEDSLSDSYSEDLMTDPTPAETSTLTDNLPPSDIITEEAQMAVHLTEFFQEQRKVYEQVNYTLVSIVNCDTLNTMHMQML